ncbi:MAG: endonuclease III domain-containing protein [Thermodesulfobacteriota bacterium]
MELVNILNKIYDKLYASFGPQNWWPAESQFEVIIGAILTQNTSWRNVEKAINNLKYSGLLTPKKLHDLSHKELACLIRSAGYFNIKSKRLKAFLDYLFDRYEGNLEELFKERVEVLRGELLSVDGIGEETADSILLYAGRYPVFVVDSYTRRILSRHHLIPSDASYSEIQRLFIENLKQDERLFNEYHALIVKVGKELCRNRNPLCNMCPLM